MNVPQQGDDLSSEDDGDIRTTTVKRAVHGSHARRRKLGMRRNLEDRCAYAGTCLQGCAQCPASEWESSSLGLGGLGYSTEPVAQNAR